MSNPLHWQTRVHAKCFKRTLLFASFGCVNMTATMSLQTGKADVAIGGDEVSFRTQSGHHACPGCRLAILSRDWLGPRLPPPTGEVSHIRGNEFIEPSVRAFA